MRGKADFRALRESLGLTRNNMARLLSVRPISVYRWENPREPNQAPADAWNLLDKYKDAQDTTVKQIVQRAYHQALETGDKPAQPVKLTYYRGQAEYEQEHDSGYYMVANATTRACATALEAAGIKIRYQYPGDSTNND